MNRTSDRKALLAAFFCNFFWGLSFMASRIAMDTAPVVVLLSHRFLLAVLVMSILLLLRRAELHLKGSLSSISSASSMVSCTRQRSFQV